MDSIVKSELKYCKYFAPVRKFSLDRQVANMTDQKRKRDGQGKEHPRKRVAVASPAVSDTVKISVLQDVDEWAPLLGN